MIFVLVLERERSEKLIFFISKAVKSAKLRYQKIERVTYVIVITRKLMPYTQWHRVMMKINYPIFHILNKQNLAGRMVSWFVKRS